MTGDPVDKETMCFGPFSDLEMACKVRMLYRDTLNHEAVVTGARDRIMWLSQENARLTAEPEEQKAVSLDINAIIRDVAKLPDRSSPEDDPEAMIVTADELKAILLSNSLPFQPLNIDDISDETILKIVGAFWRRAVPREIPLPESIVSITAMRTSLMWIDMDRYEAVELGENPLPKSLGETPICYISGEQLEFLQRNNGCNVTKHSHSRLCKDSAYPLYLRAVDEMSLAKELMRPVFAVDSEGGHYD